MVSCNILLSDGRDTATCIPRTRRGHLPSILTIKSLNTVVTETKPAHLDGVQDNLLDFCDRTRLTGEANAGGGAVSRETLVKL